MTDADVGRRRHYSERFFRRSFLFARLPELHPKVVFPLTSPQPPLSQGRARRSRRSTSRTIRPSADYLIATRVFEGAVLSLGSAEETPRSPTFLRRRGGEARTVAPRACRPSRLPLPADDLEARARHRPARFGTGGGPTPTFRGVAEQPGRTAASDSRGGEFTRRLDGPDYTTRTGGIRLTPRRACAALGGSTHTRRAARLTLRRSGAELGGYTEALSGNLSQPAPSSFRRDGPFRFVRTSRSSGDDS